MSGFPPFDGANDEEILSKVKKCSFSFEDPAWSGISNGAKNFISLLLSPLSTRITADEALKHSWLNSSKKTIKVSSEKISKTIGNLRAFQKSSKLREAVNTFITTQCVSVADTKELRDVFKAMDGNSDGKLSRGELFEHFVKEMGEEEAKEEVDRIMAEVDTDNNGYVDYTEFLKATLDQKMINSKGYLTRAFNMFDKDGNGSISASELKKILSGGLIYEESVWTDIIKQVDMNGDGEIDLKEFESILLKNIS